MNTVRKAWNIASKPFLLLIIASLICVSRAEASPFFLLLDALIWKTERSGLNFAVTSDSSSSLQNAKIQDIQFEWDGGWRVGLGYQLPHDAWDLSLTWTHFHNFARTSLNANAETFLFPVWTVESSSTASSVDYIFARWRLHLGLVDLDLKRTLFFSKMVALRPSLGVRYAVERQKSCYHYEGGDLFPGGYDLFRINNKFNGVGPRLGVESIWGLKGAFSLSAAGAFALLCGYCDLQEDETATVGNPDRLRIFNRFHMVRANCDLSAGLRWDHAFKNRSELMLKLAFEQIFFLHQSYPVNVKQNGPIRTLLYNNDLAIRGWTIASSYNF